MAKLTAKGQERLALLEQAEQSGKITAKGSEVLNALRQVSGAPLKPIEEPAQEQSGVVAKVKGVLAWPEKKSREGLDMMAQMAAPKQEVTGNMARDIAVNTPKIAVEALANVAPGFVSPESLILGGALKATGKARPLLSSMRKGAFSLGEKISGLAPKNEGILEEAYKDPTLFFSRAKEAASPIYEAGKKITGPVREALADTAAKLKFVKRVDKLVRKGSANPLEALEARKELDAIENSVTGSFFRSTRDRLDSVAKTVFKKADEVHSRGIKGKALRNLLPTNVGGTFSSWRTTGAAALATLPGGKILAPIAFSPAVQGAIATGMGAITKAASPVVGPVLAHGMKVGATASAAIKTLTEDKAREFLRKANGDPDKARAAAIRAHYKIPNSKK